MTLDGAIPSLGRAPENTLPSPSAMEGRADVFPIGVMLLDRIMDRYDQDTCPVSPYELRHGLALRALAAR